MKLLRHLAALCLLVLVVPAWAQSIPAPRALPAGGVSILQENALAGFTMQAEFSEHGVARLVDAPGTPHGKVVRLELKTTPREWWHAQVRWRTVAAMPKGSAVMLRVLVRTVEGQPETGAGKTDMGMQRAVSPWDRIASPIAPKLPVGQWTWLDLPVAVTQDYAPAQAQVVMNFGYFPQVLEIADVEVLLYGAGVAALDLPQPDACSYQGREPEAAWRVAAAERIEKYRKGDLTLRVVDAAGKPVPNAEVRVRMKKHAFLFGTCLNSNLFRQDADGEQYRSVIKENFNVAVHEGGMKWVDMVWSGGRSANARMKTDAEQQDHIAKMIKVLDWCDANGIKMRGHNLVWPGWGQQWAVLPPYLKPMVEAGDKEGVRREIENRIRTATAAFKGRVIEWDVVNESVNNHVIQDMLGREEQVRWYKLAKECDPSAKAVINDYMMLSGGAQPARIEAFYDEVKFLLDHGAPIDAIAEQAHFSWDLPGMDQTWKILERFAAFGKPMRITEFDVAMTDEKLQADYLRDFYTMAFSHPKMEEILMWGFWEGSHWLPSAAMFRKDWSPKPNYQAYRDLVFGKWWTNADVKTGADGTAKVRGFLGDYEVSVGGRVMPVTLTRDGVVVEVRH